jgi:Flp pilus assembly CpaF family ATPase
VLTFAAKVFKLALFGSGSVGGIEGGSRDPLQGVVESALAMRPDRIVVGEVRGAEAFELTRAVNAAAASAARCTRTAPAMRCTRS